jgi:uncharacterized membrane protein YfcA
MGGPATVTEDKTASSVVAPKIESGFTTSEFVATQVSSGLSLLFALCTDFGYFNFTDQQKVDLTLGCLFLIGLLQGAYAFARSIRKKGLFG